MNKELLHKFKDMLSRIINSVNKYINNNMSNPSLVESKLISINNYIIDILYNGDPTENNETKINIKINTSQREAKLKLLDRNISSSQYEEKNKGDTMNKYKKILNIDEYAEKYSNPKMELNRSHNKFKMMQLKRQLKDEHEKNKIKELSYLQKIYDQQKELFLYNREKEKAKQKNMKQKFNSVSRNTWYKNNLDGSSSNSLLGYSRKVKHSISQCNFTDRKEMTYRNKNNFNEMKLKYDLLWKKNVMKKRNSIKFDFGEIKKSIDKKMDKIKKIYIHVPMSFKNNKINDLKFINI